MAFKSLEIHKERTKLCRTSFAAFYCLEERTALITPVCCNSYFCEYCAKRKRLKVMHKLEDWSKGRKLYFYTVTIWTNWYTQERAAQTINTNFGKLIQYFRRQYGSAFEFFKVLEFTKKGYAHLHFVSDLQVPESELSKKWKTYTRSYIVKKIEINSLAFLKYYLTKYLTKSCSTEALNNWYWKFKKRRFSFSRNFS